MYQKITFTLIHKILYLSYCNLASKNAKFKGQQKKIVSNVDFFMYVSYKLG